MKKAKATPLEKILASLQIRIDKIQSIADFLIKHPFLAELSDLKPTSSGLIGLVIDDKAFVRPNGLKKPGLRMERWLEDTFTHEELEDRIVCDDISELSTDALQELLATIPNPYESEDVE